MPTETAMRLIEERRQYTCEVFGCENAAEESHHCFYHRRRGKHPVPELDMDENLQLICVLHHRGDGTANSFENRMHFWQVQCERFGHKRMVEWHQSIKLKVKEKCYT